MNFENNKEYILYGLVTGINSSDNLCNITVTFQDQTVGNLKIKSEHVEKIIVQKVYKFHFKAVENQTRMQLRIIDFKPILECLDNTLEVEGVYKSFYDYAPVSINDIKEKIRSVIMSIENDVIKTIVKDLYKANEGKFLIYPAAIRFHHNYIGGLAYHTSSMIDLADQFLKIYPGISKDLLYAGIILHDLSKVDEFTEAEATEYSLEGQLLGHLVMGAINIDRIACKHGLQNKEEVLLLKHLVISHHGQQIYGACKKPYTAEAVILWYLDSIDSKMRVLSETLDRTEIGNFTEGIGVLDRSKFYKHGLS